MTTNLPPSICELDGVLETWIDDQGRLCVLITPVSAYKLLWNPSRNSKYIRPATILTCDEEKFLLCLLEADFLEGNGCIYVSTKFGFLKSP
jgi:hypothetical protein